MIERNNLINQSLNKIDLLDIRELVVENLKNVKHKSKGKIKKKLGFFILWKILILFLLNTEIYPLQEVEELHLYPRVVQLELRQWELQKFWQRFLYQKETEQL